jgi:hypothetical protein
MPDANNKNGGRKAPHLRYGDTPQSMRHRLETEGGWNTRKERRQSPLWGLATIVLGVAMMAGLYGCMVAERPAQPECRVVTDTLNTVDIEPGGCIDIPVPSEGENQPVHHTPSDLS